MSPEDVLGYWIGDAASDPEAAGAAVSLWFEASPAVDAEIESRFAEAVARAGAGELDSWAAEPHSCLALVILLDQFPRNLFRGRAAAFQYDAKALSVAEGALASGHPSRLSLVERTFLLMPFEHSESLEAQQRCVRELTAIAADAASEWRALAENFLDFAQRHLEVIERFGRFPHRNRALGRPSTAEELAYLEGGGESFGQSAS